ncbi:MAG: aminopeptidase [Rikenellaceae bacterium]|nr:aminopeptidase [Rikenellaceae bacterium]
MNRYFKLFLALLTLYLPLLQLIQAQSNGLQTSLGGSLQETIRQIEGVAAVSELESSVFDHKLEVMYLQPLDHENPGAGHFQQRFYVLHRGYDRPVIFVTEGYRGSYAARAAFTNELAERYNANIIVAEHRFFEKSTPEPRDWDYLTVANSMGDLHRINRAMKSLYPGKWIAIGISKGGQTTIMYAAYYPEEVDIYVPYVAPVCFGVEDGRHEPFLENCGTAEDRAAILAFQRDLLERREEIQPLFEKYCSEEKLTFRMPIHELYDMCILEYPFVFWQWGAPVEEIPAPGSDARKMADQLLAIAGPEYFSIVSEPSFFVQAARELGYYGYDTKPFKGLLTIPNAKGYLHKYMLPEEARHYKFSHRVHKDIYRYLKKNDPKMIAVNGEFDPWNAVSVDKKLFRNKENMTLMVQQGGSHRARIATLSEEQQARVWELIDRWLEQ